MNRSAGFSPQEGGAREWSRGLKSALRSGSRPPYAPSRLASGLPKPWRWLNALALSLLTLGVAIASGLAADEFEGLAASAATDLGKSLAELSALRQQVESERVPLARRLRELEQQLAERRGELAKAQRFAETSWSR